MDMKLFCIFFLGVALASNIPKLDLDNFDYEEEFESPIIDVNEKGFQSTTSTPTTTTTTSTTTPSTRFSVQTIKNNTENISDNSETTTLDVKMNKTETKKDEKNNQKGKKTKYISSISMFLLKTDTRNKFSPSFFFKMFLK